MFDVSPYALLLVVHVLAAAILVGNSILIAPVRRIFVDARTVSAARLWLGYERVLARLNPISAFVLLATGIYLGSAGWWSQGWFYIAVAAWLVNSFLAARVLKPAAAALEHAVGRAGEGQVTAEIDALQSARTWTTAIGVMRGSDIAMVYVMLIKPSLLHAGAALALAVVLSLAAARAERPSRSGVPATA